MSRSRGRVREGGASACERHELRRKLSLAVLVLVALTLLARAFQVSVLQHRRWLARAESQQGDTVRVPSPRGVIYDRDGVPLAASRELYTVALAPREVKDTAEVIRKLRSVLDLDAAYARSVFRGNRRWVVLRGRFEESARAALDSIDGVHFEAVFRRFYPHGELAAELIGRVNDVGEVSGGLEKEMDSVLAGVDGRAVKRLNSLGRPIPGAMVRVVQPVPGRDVVLTIDVELQEIATDALRDALETTGAEGGEMLIVDPHTGEILAAVSRAASGGRRPVWTAVTTPYEPGSTIKPFTVASLLAEGKATLGDSIFAENGSYRLHGRTITDVHAYGWLTLREAFLHSSNIVMAKAASRLDPASQYRRLRDFGFGTPTGVTYPSESGGRLRRPEDWSKQSQASLAFGYEISVTPLQLVMAYSAIANGGVLMEPRLIREVRARDGTILRETAPRTVRRVLPAEVAASVRELLAEVVERGTGTGASLGEWKVAGKTGTARFAGGGHYVPGAYIATFAGFFPAEEPQIVFLVKLDRPRGDYYGGRTAAPVTRATLQAALAARGTPLDASAVALAGPGRATVLESEPAHPAATRTVHTQRTVHEASPVVLRPVRVAAQPAARPTVEVPDVSGLPLRDALARLHAAGLRVRVEGRGVASRTAPAAGSQVRHGATVVLRGEGTR